MKPINEILNAYTLGLITLVLWGIAPVFGKLGLNNLEPLVALMLRSAMVTIVLAIVVTLSGKWQAVTTAAGKDVLFILFEGLCAALLGQLAYFYAIKYGEVSKVAMMVAGAPLVTLMVAVLVLHEKITLWRIIGAISIIFGITVLRM